MSIDLDRRALAPPWLSRSLALRAARSALSPGVCTDADTLYHKGKTVMPQKERIESVRQCRWVDEVIENTPWVPTVAFLDEHEIDFVAHDAIPYASEDSEDVYAEVKNAGRFAETQRTEGVSTSDLILRIIRDYNEYVVRNLERGYNRKDLKISLIKEQRIKAEVAVGEMRRNLSKNIAEIKKSVSGNNLKLWKKRDVLKVDGGGVGDGSGNEDGEETNWMEEIGSNLDATLTGFIQNFERGYRQFERALSSKLKRLSSPDPEHKANKRAKGGVTKKGKKHTHSHGHKHHHKRKHRGGIV